VKHKNFSISLDMQLNTKKSICIRFGERYKVACSGLASSSGGVIDWKNNCRYLGVYFVSGRVFNCSFDYAKSKYFRSFNAILSKLGRYASEEVVMNTNASRRQEFFRRWTVSLELTACRIT